MEYRRILLIRNPPKMWEEDGHVFVDFGVKDGALLAFRPSAWLATSAAGSKVTKEFFANIARVEHLRGGGDKMEDTG